MGRLATCLVTNDAWVPAMLKPQVWKMVIAQRAWTDTQGVPATRSVPRHARPASTSTMLWMKNPAPHAEMMNPPSFKITSVCALREQNAMPWEFAFAKTHQMMI